MMATLALNELSKAITSGLFFFKKRETETIGQSVDYFRPPFFKDKKKLYGEVWNMLTYSFPMHPFSTP